MTPHATEIQQKQRFEFGKNWLRFLQVLDEDRIAEAEMSLRAMLEVESLSGKSFLDVGSGSGLFSLAAMRLGAAKVYSFDYDPQSVACAHELKRRFYPDAERWSIEEGSVLDTAFLSRLGEFDVVYSWGVLHHTGKMWQALANVVPLVTERGKLFIAIYNDQGWTSRGWKAVKAIYNKGLACRLVVCAVFVPYFVGRGLASDVVKMKNPLSRYRDYKKSRGMSLVYDWFDWLGGYPFEVAKPEEIFEHYRKRGFTLVKLATCAGSLGNNQFVFRRGTA